jgi:signal transduction histidine kinase
MTFYMLVHEEDLALVRRNYEQRMSTGRSTDRYILRALRRDGSVIFVEVIVSTIVYNNSPAVIGSLIDITDRLQEENRLNKAVIDAQERERLEIGMELHDNVQQLMAGSLLTLDYVRSAYDDKEEVLRALGNIRGYISEGIGELRRLSHQLAPSMGVSSESLSDKIHSLVESMNVGGALDVDIEVDDFEVPLVEAVQLAFYRILQEQLSNILKYAAATRVAIRVKRVGGQIILSIRDNGCGFDPGEKREGIGLENIRRRVNAMDGDLRIVSAEGEGCELSLKVGG